MGVLSSSTTFLDYILSVPTSACREVDTSMGSDRAHVKLLPVR